MDNLNILLANLLNLSISDIDSINSSVIDNKTHIYITLRRLLNTCPICNSSTVYSKGFYSRTLKIPDLPFQNTIVHQRVRRYFCRNCNHSYNDLHYMAPLNHSVSYSTIFQLMELLKNPKITFHTAATIIQISDSSVIRLFDKHCHITRSPFPEVVCIDEVYTKNSSYNSKYSCIFYDFFQQTILDVTPSRHKSYLHKYFQNIPKQELLGVLYICIDMYMPYKQIAQIYFKKAILCVDSFHVVKHINDDLSKLRVRIMKSYTTDSIEYYLLKHWKNLLFDRSINLDNKGKFNKRLNRHVNFRQLLDLLLDISPQLKLAFELKEKYMIFNSTCSLRDAPFQLDNLIDDFVKCEILEYTEFTGLLQNWRDEIINSFTIYKGRRINNSVAESMNALIKDLLHNTKGIRNSERRKKRIMYAVNKTNFTIK